MSAASDARTTLDRSPSLVSFRAGGLRETATLATLGGVASLAVTGFVYGVDNNLFHLAILGDLQDLPQFAGDEFAATLRHYAAGPWMLLAGAARWVDPYWVLFALALISRILAFAGFLVCASTLGVTGRAERATFTALLVAVAMLQGYSYAGKAGLFINYGTHSELANGLLLLSWAAAARARFVLALALTGAAFFCNAFMGVWNLVALAPAVGLALQRGTVAPPALARQLVIGSLACLALAAPVIWRIVANPDFGLPTAFDYREFIAFYWPEHFLLEGVAPKEVAILALIAAAGFVGLIACGPLGRPYVAILAGLVLLYAAGLAAAGLTHSRTILNLHLLRSGGAMQMLAALAMLAPLAKMALRADRPRRAAAAAVLAAALCSVEAAFALALALLAFLALRERLRASADLALQRVGLPSAVGAALLAAIAVAATGQAIEAHAHNRRIDRAVADWGAIADWSRAATPADTVFLVPSLELGGKKNPGETAWALRIDVAAGAQFEYRSQRRVFVDFKRGAAVMWSPSYHDVWRRRIEEVAALKSLNERLAYASGRGVAYVVDRCAGDGPAPAFATATFCVYAAR